MFGKLFGLSDDPISLFFSLSVGGMVYFFALASISYFSFFVLFKKRFHPEDKPDWKENRRGMKWAILSLLGNAALTAPIHWAVANGYSKMYYDFSDYSWWWVPVSIVLLLVVTETAIYWTHRWLHTKSGWLLHKTHHSWQVTTPWTGVAFNPLDSFAQALPHHLCAFFFPMHATVYLASVSLVTVWAVLIHDRLSFVRWKGINYTGHHTLHHWYSDYNYGQYFTFWDRVGGTYKDPDSCYDEIPSWVHRPPRYFGRDTGAPATNAGAAPSPEP